MISYFHNAICIFLVICSKSQPDDDPVGSKRVAMFDCCLFAPYFIVLHRGMLDFEMVTVVSVSANSAQYIFLF